MDSIKYEAFITAAETGSLTATAEALGYTQPGITRMIRSLEEACGFTLLSRTKRGVAVTENGKAMLPYFRDIVRAQKNAWEMCMDIQGVLKGALTIGSYFSVSTMIMPEIFKTFSEKYPHIYLKLREGSNADMAQWLQEKSIDCCFAPRPQCDISFDWIPVWSDEMVAWLPANHRHAHDVFPVKELEGEPFIITNPNQDTDIDRLLETYDVHPDIRLSTVDAYATWRMVEAGLGMSCNQRLIFKNWRGNVAAVPFDPPQYITLGITVPSLKEASPSTKKLIDYVVATYGRLD